MPTTTTTLGRLELVNPDLGYDGGAGLQTVEETLRTKISDAITSRYYASSAVADSTTTEYRHNFGIALEEFSVLIYTGSHPNLTRVDDPVGAGWTIAAKVGEEKETIEVTTPASGGPHTYAVFAIHGGAGGGGLELALISGADTAVPNTHYLVDGTAAPYTITLPQGQDGAVLRFSDATGDWGTSNVTLQGDGAETIRLNSANNDNTLVLDVLDSWVQLMWDGTQWIVDSPLTGITSGDFTGDVTIGGTLGVDSITDFAGTGAPNFPNGFTKGRVDFAVFELSADISVVDSVNTAYSNIAFSYGDSSITTNGASITVPSTGYWKITVNIAHSGSFNRARMFDAGNMMTDAGLNGTEVFDTRHTNGFLLFTGTGSFIGRADSSFVFSPTYFIDTTAATVIVGTESWIMVEKISELT